MSKIAPSIPDPVNPKDRRKLHRMLWQLLSRSVVFWVPALLFLVLANEVRGNDPLPGDIAILTTLNTFSSTWLTAMFMVITSLGSALFVVAGVLIASCTMWYIGQRKHALFLLFAAGGTSAINIVFKLLFARDRPDVFQHMVIEDGYSFPSGHAMISMSLALAVIILAWQTKYRLVAIVCGLLYALLVGVSRLYLGVHYPSDVIGGWCVSILWVLTLYHVLARFSARGRIPFLSK